MTPQKKPKEEKKEREGESTQCFLSLWFVFQSPFKMNWVLSWLLRTWCGGGGGGDEETGGMEQEGKKLRKKRTDY